MKKKGYRRKTTFEEKTSGLIQIRPVLPSCCTVSLLTNPDRSGHWVDLSGRSGFNNNAFNGLDENSSENFKELDVMLAICSSKLFKPHEIILLIQ